MNELYELIDLFYQSEDYFFRSISTDCVDFDDMATAYLTGVSIPDLNPVSIRKNTDSITAILKRSKQFYDLNQCPWVVTIPEAINSESNENSMKNVGLQSIGKSVAMFIELNQRMPLVNTQNCVIKTVDHDLADWMTPLVSAFESTFEVTKQYAATHAKAIEAKSRLHHYSAYDNNLPISSMTLSIHKKITRIDDVGTMPAYQNRGYASRLINHVLSCAIQMGGTYCFLEASDSVASFYQSLGFRSLFDNVIFSSLKST